MIELSGVCKFYGPHRALHDIDLSIASGEIFGIIGRSGAGKSTLLRCINLLERPDAGQIVVDQRHLLDLTPAQLRQARHHIAMIFQHFNLLTSKTVYENIALPLRIQQQNETVIRQKVEELLALVELENKRHAYPHALSGGQKQRVAIARALSSTPQILLCDEATSALDPESTQGILTLLKKINHLYGITIVLITHQMEVVKRICHRLAVMEHGEIKEITTLAHAFTQKNSLARALLYAQLSPTLPPCLYQQITSTPNDRPLLRLLFEGDEATVPFISQASRLLNLDINILLANIDRFDGLTCGVLIIELVATPTQLAAFIQRCTDAQLTVENLGYVSASEL